MSKKKNQHKGKPKHASKQSDDFSFDKNKKEPEEEEYETVTDYDKNKKYSKRLIESNWARYEASPGDFKFESETADVPKTDDFTYLLKTASSDCSHFQFSSEKQWDAGYETLPSSKLFSLDINVLSQGLACIPFYDRIGINKNDLSEQEVEKFDKEAENSWKEYSLIRKKLDSDNEIDNETKTLDDSLRTKLSLSDSNKNEEKSSSNSIKGADNLKKKLVLNDNEENLEDWLDSVLDD